MFCIIQIHVHIAGFKSLKGNRFHLRIKLFAYWVFSVWIGLIKMSLKLCIRNFISIFIFSIIIRTLLDRIISQMNHFVYFFNIIVERRCPDISLSKPIQSHSSIHLGCQHKMTNIKFSSLVEHGPFNILLNNVGSLLLFFIFCVDNFVNFIKLIYNFDPIPSVSVLSWFDDPYISTWFVFLKLFVIAQKLRKCITFCSSFPDVKCQRNNIIHILSWKWIIIF